jgi:hypothetical protein
MYPIYSLFFCIPWLCLWRECGLVYLHTSTEIETAIAMDIDSYETRCPYAGGIAKNLGKSHHNCFVYLKIMCVCFLQLKLKPEGN